MLRQLFIFLLSAGSLLGQLPVIPLQSTSSTAATTPCTITDPSGSNSLYAYWNFQNIALVNARVNDTNPWIDCVSGIKIQQDVTTSIDFWTNRSTGVEGFEVSNNGGAAATNAPLAPGTNSTITLVLYPYKVTAGVAVMGIYYPFRMNDADQPGHPSGLIIDGATGVSPHWSWSYPFVGGASLSSTIAASNWYDVTLVQSNTTVYCYTNGILSKSISGYTPPAGGWPWKYLGEDLLSNEAAFVGLIPQIFVWSNVLSAGSILGGVHHYTSNRFNYSP